MDSPVVTELKEVFAYYDLGQLVDYEKNERGFVNTAYAIDLMYEGHQKRYFLRKYKRGIGEEELRFEHSLIEHLVAAGSPVARIHHTRSGESFLRCRESADDAAGVFYTVFDYLPGDDRFTWVDPILTEGQLIDSAAVLAQLHIDAGGFVPQGERVEPRILDLLPIIADTWAGCPSRSKGTIFDMHIGGHLEQVRTSIAATLAQLQEPAVRSLPEMVIHCDYHPGNLKFSGDTVTGVFDFDWSKVDWRLFDLGLALWYFCTSWRGGEDGSLRLDWAHTFLSSYQQRLVAHGGLPVTSQEAHYLPVMVNAGNLYVLYWTIMDYFAKDVDPSEYLVFLDHSLNFARWYEKPGNRESLNEVIASVISAAT